MVDFTVDFHDVVLVVLKAFVQTPVSRIERAQ
jgi:hypothetical protein